MALLPGAKHILGEYLAPRSRASEMTNDRPCVLYPQKEATNLLPGYQVTVGFEK